MMNVMLVDSLSTILPLSDIQELPFLKEDEIDRIIGFRSCPVPNTDFFLILKKNSAIPTWYPAELLTCPDILHKFLLNINDSTRVATKSNTVLQGTPSETKTVTKDIIMQGANGDTIGVIKSGSSEFNLIDILQTRSLKFNKSITSGTLSLILSSLSSNNITQINVIISSPTFRPILAFSKISGILPSCQVNDNLIILLVSNELASQTLLIVPRPSYYDSLNAQNDTQLADYLKSKQSIKCGSSSISWNFVEMQSLNSIFKLPRFLLNMDSFKFAIHAPSSLSEVQQFGRWLSISKGAVYVGHPSSFVISNQRPDVDTIFIHFSCLGALHNELWVSKLLRISFGIRYFVFGTQPTTTIPIIERIPFEILPLDGGGLTTFSLRLLLFPSNEFRIREYIKCLTNFPGWSLLLPSGLFDALKLAIDSIQREDPIEAKRLHLLRNDLFRSAFHETSKEASIDFSELEFIVGCAKTFYTKHRFFVLVDDPTQQSNSILSHIFEKYPKTFGNNSPTQNYSSLVSIGTFSDLVNQFN